MPNGRPMQARSLEIKDRLEGKEAGESVTFDLLPAEIEQFSRFTQRARTVAKGLAMKVSVRSDRDDRTKAIIDVKETGVEVPPAPSRRRAAKATDEGTDDAPRRRGRPRAAEAAAEAKPAETVVEVAAPEAHADDVAEADEAAPSVVLCVTGSVSAYKAPEIVRGLQKAGVDVAVAMTPAAERFVGQATFASLTDLPVAIDLFDWSVSQLPHIDLAEWADLIVVAPASADAIAKIAHGFADDCVCATVLAATSKVMVCPAMNVHMWQNPATQANVATLRERGIMVMEPTEGYLVCGDWGEGKLAPVDGIVRACLDELKHAE